MNTLPHQIDLNLEKLTADADEPRPRSIGCVDIDWKRIYFPYCLREIPDSPQEQGVVVPNRVTFNLPHPAHHANQLPISAFKSIREAEPFSEFGLRSVTIETQPTPIHVFQAITQVTPGHVIVESTNCKWSLGMALKAVPNETLDKLLKRQLQWDDIEARLALVKFYIQAQYFSKALEELALIRTDFPDQKELIEKRSQGMMDSYHVEIERRLEQCKSAGQHIRAEQYVSQLITQPINETIRQNVFQHAKSHEETRRVITSVISRLSDFEAKITDSEQQTRLHELFAEVREQLDFETLPRLGAFLNADADNQYQPDQRLGLACSGWVLGSENAIPDLGQALRLWVARNAILDDLRGEDFIPENELMEKLQVLEELSAAAMLNLIALLPPLLESTGVEPGSATLVQTSSSSKASYSVMLPTEYSHHHSYPLLIALRSSHRSNEETLSLWAGGDDNSGLGDDRGYIVIAPDCAEPNAETFSYSSAAQKIVLDCLIDARKRFSIDSDRVFIAGHGTGADVAFEIGLAHPDEFAGVLPIGGHAMNYCNYTCENSGLTGWYVVGKGIDSKGTRESSNDRIFEKMMKSRKKSDFMLVEYLGRDGESATDAIPDLFDWMDLHARQAQPRQFSVCSLRRTNNRFFWLTADRLPRDYSPPLRRNSSTRIAPMEIDVSVTLGNTIYLKSPSESHTLRLTPELVDFNKRVIVKVNGVTAFSGLVKPNIRNLMEDLRNRGDRKRLTLAVLAI